MTYKPPSGRRVSGQTEPVDDTEDHGDDAEISADWRQDLRDDHVQQLPSGQTIRGVELHGIGQQSVDDRRKGVEDKHRPPALLAFPPPHVDLALAVIKKIDSQSNQRQRC